MDSEVEVTASTLAALTGKMPVVKDTDAYHLSIGPWQIFEEAVATL